MAAKNSTCRKSAIFGPLLFAVDTQDREHDQVGEMNVITPPKLMPPFHSASTARYDISRDVSSSLRSFGKI
jgi:hypothetical protein